jgi:hypothetical protein
VTEIRTPGELYRVEPKPGEFFVLRVDNTITHDEVARFIDVWESLFRGIKLLVIDQNFRLSVASPTQDMLGWSERMARLETDDDSNIGAGLAAVDPFPECVSTVNFDNDPDEE